MKVSMTSTTSAYIPTASVCTTKVGQLHIFFSVWQLNSYMIKTTCWEYNLDVRNCFLLGILVLLPESYLQIKTSCLEIRSHDIANTDPELEIQLSFPSSRTIGAHFYHTWLKFTMFWVVTGLGTRIENFYFPSILESEFLSFDFLVSFCSQLYQCWQRKVGCFYHAASWPLCCQNHASSVGFLQTPWPAE